MTDRHKERERLDLLQGTLDLLILRTLQPGPAHGHRIAHSIEETSGAVLRVDHGSLYPALQRLERRGWITAEWGTSENNRRARYYRLTAAGRRQLGVETTRWEQLAEAIARVLASVPERGEA
jgi:PadR family transcriptional regulator, regulatory protein PadR